jgi:hypothetical protein
LDGVKPQADMLLKFNEQVISDFLIPSFKVKSGNIAVIQFPSGPYFYPLMMEMKDIIVGKTPKDGVLIYAMSLKMIVMFL